MLVVFRADASIQIGTGHVMRCLTLADELSRQGHDCLFICREHPGHLGDVITSRDHSLTLLPAPNDNPSQRKSSAPDDYERWLGVPWQVDAGQTLDTISPLNPDCLVVDHYALDAQWECTVSSAVSKIMVIDDLANRPHECALLLDQNLGRVTLDYDGLLPAECQRLIGPRYALLRPEFAALREQSLNRRKAPELNRILISLGGVDRMNVTGQVLEALGESQLPHFTELDIIMGGGSPYIDKIRKQIKSSPFSAIVSVDVRNMAERMCLADLAIGAAGGTSWERSCLGLPSILVVMADNQLAGAKALDNIGAAITITDATHVGLSLTPVLEELSDLTLLRRMSKINADITDGQGAITVIETMNAVMGEVNERV